MTRTEVLDTVIDHISHSTNASVVGFSGAGKDAFLNEILERYNDSVQFIHIDVTNAATLDPTDFHRIVHYEVSKVLEKLNSSISEPKFDTQFGIHQSNRENLKLLLEIVNKPVVFQISNLSRLYQLEESFFNTIESLRRINRGRIAFFFIDQLNLISRMKLKNTGELYDEIKSNLYYIPLPNLAEYKYALNYSISVLNYTPSKQLVKNIHGLTGGHYGIAHQMIRLVKENDEKWYQHKEYLKEPAIELRIKKTLNQLNLTEKSIISKIVQGKQLTQFERTHAKTLVQSGLLLADYSLGIPIFQEYLERDKIGITARKGLDMSFSKMPMIEIDKGIIKINGHQITNDLTTREFELLYYFLDNPQKIVSREKIGQLIWGRQLKEKYSDWAIDQVISRLRKKLHDTPNKPRFIETVKGQGFRFIA